MAKTKTQKELLASVRESTLAYNYDLTTVDAREYAVPLAVLFNSSNWKDIFIRRNKLYRAAMTGDNNAFKQMEQIDRKVGFMILQAMHKYALESKYKNEGKIITLNEYFTDFVRTEEQHELYNQFSLNLDSTQVLADILDSLLTDTNGILRKLDPSVVLSEFDGIKSALSALKDFTHIHHRDEHEELRELFEENEDECEEYLRMKTALFVKKYKDKREELINNGSLNQKTVKKLTDREYCIDLLSNHIYIQNNCEKSKRVPSNTKAREVIGKFSDEEMPELLKVVHSLYVASEAVHQAKEKRNTIVKTLPINDTTKKIVEYIL